MRNTFLRVLTLIICLSVCVGCATWPGSGQETKIFLVRHAEKQKGDNPSLTLAGEVRARALAERLGGEKIRHLHSTDYNRTRETAAPVASRFGLAVQIYDPRNLPAFATILREQGGRHLVVGHSNTTPALVKALGGDPGAPITEATEYNRLYILTLNEDGSVITRQERYGPSNPSAE